MADDQGTEEESAPAEKKSSNMLMIIIIVVLILVILIGAVVAILLMSGDDEQAHSQAPQAQERKAAPKKSRSSSSTSSDYEDSRRLSDIGILYPLDTFTVNLKSDAGRRYLKVSMSLELEGEELSLELDAKSPVIRDRVIRILTSKTLEDISSKQGKQKISLQIMDTLRAMLSDGDIKGIYFTEFVIQ